jgi:predicted nucleotidyltransferase
MPEATAVERALAAAASELTAAGKQFALVGGFAVSVRAEPRFTRDVDFAVAVADDREAEALVYELRNHGYTVAASVEHDTRGRLATVRLLAPQRVKVDLLFASSGIEHEAVARATVVAMPGVVELLVVQAEELLAMKVLSMTEERLQDRIDAKNLLLFNPDLDLKRVHELLRLITERGFHREQDLETKLQGLLLSKS